MRQPSNLLYSLKSKLIYFEKLLAASSLLLLLIISITQVIFRNFFELGFSNLEVISRHLVLFITFMGAALISEGNQHIKIDCINAVIDSSVKQKLTRPLFLISSLISSIFCWYSCQFWIDENLYAPNNEQLALYLALIIPLGFFILSLHFLLLGLLNNTAQNIAEQQSEKK